VVDFRSLGGPVESACAKVPAGTSGSRVLEAAGHKVTYRPQYGDDFICAIDGKPENGCAGIDGNHYWVYYHRAPGATSWQMSSEGAGTYQPANKSTEGWVYDNGASTPPQPSNVAYSRICPATQTPRPSTRSTATHPAPAPTRAAAQVPGTTAARPAATTTAETNHPSPPPTATTTSAASESTTAAAGAPLPGAVTPIRPHPSPGTPWGLVIGIVAVATLGAAAFLRLRRSDG
jgi:hypothetical protein